MEKQKLISKIINKKYAYETSFPKKLTKEEESFYISQMKNGNKKAEEILINHNMRLVAFIVRKYKGSMEFDDMLSIGSIGLIKGIRSFNPDKNFKLSTYLAICIENEVKMALRKNNKYKIVSLDAPVLKADEAIGNLLEALDLEEYDKFNDLLDSQFLKYELQKFMQEFLDEDLYQIVCLRFGFVDGVEYTQAEIAERMNISRSYVSRLCAQAIKILKENIDYYLTEISKR